ncbi:hypothetical protein ACFVFS_01715 [Kitasatospora sp. NPDC057692]|uniref:hypothetical protein n=1 Tax=Kitasatospora sp. NPDC057692 TaxID=3346215 RepID=UPI003698FAFC
MATSDGGGGWGGRVLGYLGSAGNIAACTAGAGGLVLHFAGYGGDLWPVIVAGLYGAVASLWWAFDLGGSKRPSEAVGTREPGPAGRVPGGSERGDGPERRPGGSGVATGSARPGPGAESPPAQERATPPATPPAAPPVPRIWPQLEELAAFVGSAQLPPSANVPGLLVRLRTAGPGPTTEPIVRRRLPLAVDGYLRALTWQPWVADGADPVAELARAVDEMAALVPAS